MQAEENKSEVMYFIMDRSDIVVRGGERGKELGYFNRGG